MSVARGSLPSNDVIVLEWLQLGGMAMLALGLMSVLSVTLTIIKVWEFSEWRLGSQDFIDPVIDAWERDDQARVDAALSDTTALLSRVLAEAIALLRQGRYSAGQARERIEQLANQNLVRCRRHIRVLELVGSLAPLVGLLGTVVGMIDAFQALQAAGDRIDPSVLSGGIWKALLTTAAGLVVAIPVIAAAHYLEQRVSNFQLQMESALTRLLTRPDP